ncbi:hypothetical protein ACIP88_05030 [Streptomyces uncialis]|uniref:hypothetical protein n=1 Tax=Streptomyces uncialis TaxID=1048205 RepID=UPI00381BF2ED
MTLIASSEWYASSTLWTTVTTSVVALSVGALAAWATLRSTNPKRRLSYHLRENVALLDIETHAVRLSVSHGDTQLRSPRIVELVVKNSGRRDITSAQFHDGDPIVFDLQSRVVALISVSAPSTTIAPEPVVDATKLLVGPSLLKSKQEVSYTMLVDGEVEDVRCTAPLTDTHISRTTEDGDRLPPPLVKILGGIAVLGIFLFASEFVEKFIPLQGRAPEQHLEWSQIRQCAGLPEVTSIDQCEDVQKVLRQPGPPAPTP